MTEEAGVASSSRVGFDISCGARSMRTCLTAMISGRSRSRRGMSTRLRVGFCQFWQARKFFGLTRASDDLHVSRLMLQKLCST
jgi:hypothetical protein